jgi:hypothetical protein
VQLRLAFSDARFEQKSPLDVFDLLLGVVATFEILVGDRVLHREEGLPIVELRGQLVRWAQGALANGEDFAYDSLESDEPGFVWFRRQPEGGWRVGSLYQDYIEITVWSDDQVREVISRFAKNVDDWVESNLGVQVDRVIPG